MRNARSIARFLESAACMLAHTTSSADLELVPLILAATNSTPGVFVEIGANDGYSDSMTYILERCFGWKGVLIEAQPDVYRLLERSNRTSVKVHAAACEAGTSV